MKILSQISAANIAKFRHQCQQTHAYGRSHAFPCFDQISSGLWAVVAGLISYKTEMWEGVDVPQHYLNPLGNAEDFTLLKYLVNRNEQTFLGVLQENYPGHNDHNPNTMLVRAHNSKMSTTFMTKNGITKLNELFGLQQWCHKGNFTDDQHYPCPCPAYEHCIRIVVVMTRVIFL